MNTQIMQALFIQLLSYFIIIPMSCLMGCSLSFAQTDSASVIPAQTTESRETYKQVQLQTIFLSFVDFHNYASLKEIQDQIYGIPGITDFIPYQETKGLITYDLRYSGNGKLLQKALQETLGTRFEIGVKRNDKDLWEFTIRKL